jgi:NAD(P)-dependent dehydrogenase (short-subunit alcohol dehydrogenase family)
MSFAGHTIVVTGGAGGLGSAIARAFADAGGDVVIADLDDAAGQRIADDIGTAARYLPLDVTEEASWMSLLDSVDEQLGGLNVLVNNAGFYAPNIPFEDMPIELWRKHFAINSDGVFLGCKHGILRMKSRGGAIVNLGSTMSIQANPTGSAYCGSKAAVLMTTRTAAKSAGQYNIRVNAVLPGAVPTAMLMGNLREGETEADLIERLRVHSPLDRLATPNDIATAVLFLADPSNTAITGSCLPVDGGNMPGA